MLLTRFNLAEREYRGIGAEIGVREGLHAKFITALPNVEMLHGIDINNTVAELYKNPKFSFHKGWSTEVAKQFDDGFFDFIYIDADHSYESARDDIAAWYPKLKVGGMFAGHDYVGHWPGVIRAVEEFAEANGLHVQITGIPYENTKDNRKKYADELGQLLEVRRQLLPKEDPVYQELSSNGWTVNTEQMCPTWYIKNEKT